MLIVQFLHDTDHTESYSLMLQILTNEVPRLLAAACSSYTLDTIPIPQMTGISLLDNFVCSPQ